MKNLLKNLAPAFILALFMLSAGCKKNDEVVDTPSSKICKLTELKGSGIQITFTYDGDFLIRQTEDGLIHQDYTYRNEKLTSIIRSFENLRDTVLYHYGSNGLVNTRTQIWRGKVIDSLSLLWNEDQTIKAIYSFHLVPGKTGFRNGYFFSYENHDLKKMQIIYDENGDGILDSSEDESEIHEFILSDKPNPLYGYYLYQYDFSDLSWTAFTKNTVLSHKITWDNGPMSETYHYAHSYNSWNYPIKTMETNWGFVLNYAYFCK